MDTRFKCIVDNSISTEYRVPALKHVQNLGSAFSAHQAVTAENEAALSSQDSYCRWW